MRTVYPVGTTLYKPGQCWNGYTLLWHGRTAKLVDMNGRTVHGWQCNAGGIEHSVSRARLLQDGNLLVQRGGMMDRDGAIQEYAWDGDMVWDYTHVYNPREAFLGLHHDVYRKENGNTLLICRVPVPEAYMSRVRDAEFKAMTLYVDAILEVNRAREIVWEWHAYEHLDLNTERVFADPAWWAGPYNNAPCDWTHVNTVQALPENRWYDAGDVRFRPGNVMVSPRTMDRVYIIDRETKDLVWSYRGDYRGGISGQHEPHMIEKDLPGAGNILMFDNGASPFRDLAHCGRSYALEIDPTTKTVVWVYDGGEQFHSNFTSSTQRLGNGNTLICESAGKRVFEVTPACEIVWEYVEGSSRSYRYPYDYCPQTAALGVPKEVSVTPPERLTIAPDGPLDG
jgi:hypothetical protein